MSSVDKVKVAESTYDISPSKDGTLTGFTSNDAASPTAWTDVNVVTASDTNSTIFSKVTTMVKNIRWLYSKLGTTDFSATGQSTVTGALSSLQTGLNGKADASHSHTTAQLPVSSSQTNSNSYIPTSALVYSMQQQITSLNDALSSLSGQVMKHVKSINYSKNTYDSENEIPMYTFTESFKCVQVVQLHVGAWLYGSFSITNATQVIACTNVKQDGWDGRRCVVQTGIYTNIQSGSVLKARLQMGGTIYCYN